MGSLFMTEKPKVNCRFSACKGIGFFLLLVALCMVTGIVSATTYTAADQNANGQYQIVYTVNPDNSQTFKAAGVAYGTMEVESIRRTGQSTSQDVQMSGQYGYALIAAQDSSGNQADSETWLYNGDANVHQYAGVIQPDADTSTQNQFGDILFPSRVPMPDNAYSREMPRRLSLIPIRKLSMVPRPM